MGNDAHAKPIFLPRGVAGPEKLVGYIAEPAGGIEAIDLLAGGPDWRTETDAWPAIVIEKWLAVVCFARDLPGALQVVALDRSKQGEPAVESAPLVFPDWVSAAIIPGELFSYRVSADGRVLIFEWEAHARYRGGAPPPASVLAQATRDAAGIFHVDIETGEVKSLPAQKQTEISLPAVWRQQSMFSYQMGPSSSWHTEPWSVDDKFAVIIGEVLEDQQSLRLLTWNSKTGQVEDPVALATGPALVSYVTPDGRNLLVHSEGAESRAGDSRPWRLFSVITGKRLATLNYEAGAQDACVIDSNLYYVVEDPASGHRTDGDLVKYRMKAVDIISAKPLWERELSEQRTRKPSALRQ
ncbi:MAG TPA: hypothetical protein VN937_08765 [Blastocatellia bacterium]|nr:hypothetical protein [Blastocatellia bacterium]